MDCLVQEQNDFFYPNACQICGCMENIRRLLRCGKCQMVSYCGKKHQIEHWSTHKSFCKVLADTRKRKDLLKEVKGRKQEAWVSAKLGLINTISGKLLRKLTPYEQKVIKFTRACVVCHDTDQSKLINCPNCPLASFCQQHKEIYDQVHVKKCPEFKLCYNLDLEKLKARRNEMKTNPFPKNKSETKKNFLDIRIFVIKAAPMELVPYFDKCPDSMISFLNIFSSKQPNTFSSQRSLEWSDFFMKPLSVFRALEKINQVQAKDLTIHVIGAKVEDLDIYLFWETLFHWMPKLDSLGIVLFSQEFEKQKLSPKLCDSCLEKNKNIFFEMYNLGYNQFVKEQSFLKPNLVIGFNIQVKKEAESLLNVANLFAPFALTSDLEKTAKEEHKEFKKIFKEMVDFETREKNPFSGLKPSLDFETDGVSYENQFLTIYSNLRKSEKKKGQAN